MTLFNDGDAGEFLIIILTGKIQVIKHAKSIATVGPGEYLGEMSLIDGAPRFASCVTLEPTDFAVLTRQALVDILLKMPRLGNKLLLVLLQTLNRRLRETSSRPALSVACKACRWLACLAAACNQAKQSQAGKQHGVGFRLGHGGGDEVVLLV